MGNFFLPDRLPALIRNYAIVSALYVAISLLFGWLFNADLLLRALAPKPLEAISAVLTPFAPEHFFLSLWIRAILAAVQIVLLFGALRLALLRVTRGRSTGVYISDPGAVRNPVSTSAPIAAEGIPVNGRKLRRPWWVTPIFMTLATVATMYLVIGYSIFLINSGSRFHALTLGEAMGQAGQWPLWIGLGLAALGFMNGQGFTNSAQPAMVSNFGVQYLPDDHWLTQDVHALADRLEIPRPSVGYANVLNAFACGPDVNNASVVLGVPLIEALELDELHAIIGHELGHVVSGDMRQMQFAEGYQSMFGFIFGGLMSGIVNIAASHASDRGARVAIGEIGTSVGTFGRYLFALGSELMVKRLSRKREFYADAIGAAVTSPDAMKRALEKIHSIPEQPSRVESHYGYLMFRGASFGRLFATHPSLNRRVAALASQSYVKRLPQKRD